MLPVHETEVIPVVGPDKATARMSAGQLQPTGSDGRNSAAVDEEVGDTEEGRLRAEQEGSGR